MKFKNIDDVTAFLQVIDECKNEVYLTSQYGDKYNLKSKMSQYVAMAALLGTHGEELELWANDKEDETRLLNFLNAHPNIV